MESNCHCEEDTWHFALGTLWVRGHCPPQQCAYMCPEGATQSMIQPFSPSAAGPAQCRGAPLGRGSIKKPVVFWLVHILDYALSPEVTVIAMVLVMLTVQHSWRHSLSNYSISKLLNYNTSPALSLLGPRELHGCHLWCSSSSFFSWFLKGAECSEAFSDLDLMLPSSAQMADF